MRLKLVRDVTSIDFFSRAKLWLGLSGFLVVLAFASFMLQGLNYGIDFSAGTILRTKTTENISISDYRQALGELDIGDFSITDVYDPTFEDNEFVRMVRFQGKDDEEVASVETMNSVESALRAIDPNISFTAGGSVGPKVSQELIQSAVIAVILAIVVVLIYIWIRFEWQFALGAVLALVHDVILTIGIFSEFQIKFDLAIIAALLTIVGYSLNDSVVVFDRVRENLRKYKSQPLREVLNRSINETLSRTLMTSVTTLIALLTLLVLGGDVIRGFVFAMTWGVIVGTYSSVFVASAVIYVLGVKRDWSKTPDQPNAGTQF